ncbi:TRL-like family protein [Leptospira ryugenii]|uniref:TRL-like family protein n=1 Tax=Leptospira ryugenii TaxID=1917863 RepID=A0A2P2E243_9LEPT|nr:TRL-like family protein [Leptospira ryugenii]GBF50967.1 TRL-like family protein [Leptospira ryugenii]
MKKTVILLFLTIFLGFYSCATGPTHGLIFTYNDFPGEFNPNNDVKAIKSAEGCQHAILGLFTFGDAGAGQVARDNKIERIATIDHSTISVWTLAYRSYCTKVTGE